MRIFICIFISIFLIGTLSAQSYVTKKTAGKKALKFYMKGKELGRTSDSAKALESFEKALKEEPTFIDAKIEWAAIKYVKGNATAAEKALEEVIGMDPYYNTKLLYTLAVIKKKNDNCKEAKKYYEQYIVAPKAREVLIVKSKKGIEDCNFTLDQGSDIDYASFDPKPISDNVNTKSREYFPSISADGETFFFTRVTRGQEDIYYCNKTENGWGEALPLSDINTKENEANQSISADGRVIVFTACNRQKTGYGSCDLYLSEFKNGAWTPVVNMGRAINSTAWESQPSLSADGNLLYFTSKRTGNTGKSDIYYSKRNEAGAWSVAKLVKGEINTKGEEQTPFIHQDGQTLYFKSTGHPGLGGYDIFYSRLQKDGTWGKPVNLSAPINSKYDEGNFVVSLDGKTAYFDSDKKMTNKGAGAINENLHDIYEIELDEKLRPFPVTYVKAKVVDAQTNKPLVAKVDFMNLGTQKRHAFNISNEKGEFLVCLPVGKNYGLNVAKEGYLFYSDNFALDGGASMEEPYVLEIKLNPIPPAIAAVPVTTKPSTSNPKPTVKPTATILKNIFFASGSAVLKPESTGELLKLYDLLQANPKMNIQINGHTDDVGADAANLTLSEKRAKAVHEYLIQKGITSSRLKYKGYGESQPIITNETEEGRQMNRRTEFIVL